MELVKLNSTMKRAISSHNMAYKTYLYQCYAKPSYNKVKAYEKCLALVSEYNGKDYRITGYNSDTFSFAFYGTYQDKKAFFYITKDHSRVCFMEAE